MAKRNELKTRILKILQDYPKSRDSDAWLTIKLWCVFYPSRIIRKEADCICAPGSETLNCPKHTGKEGEPMIRLKDIMDLPREDHVKRIRAIIQNEEHKFLPTSWEVAKQRKINETDWKEYCLRITP